MAAFTLKDKSKIKSLSDTVTFSYDIFSPIMK